jgi:hypothetical protein
MPDDNKPIVAMSETEFASTWRGLSRDLHTQMLDDARETRAGLPLRLAVAVLVLPDGKRRVAHYCPEYGDDEGRRQVWEFVVDARRLLLPGEQLELEMHAFPLREVRESL